ALLVLAAGALFTPKADAVVFINEVCHNPAGSGSFDDTYEFIELMGTPGMKLDGYAVALINGMQEKYYPLGSIPPAPIPDPEIDELFSLDGLRLGSNGILVLTISAASNFPTIVADSNVRPSWFNDPTFWNGGLDLPTNLGNDGSNTYLLVRNRPGRTQANPTNPAGLRWGKDIKCDAQLITPVTDPQSGQTVDQYGDGTLDKGDPNGMSGVTLDLKGASTPANINDDLEVVDEISYEHDRGWEYQCDDRKVDVGNTGDAYPERDVHALDDPGAINPDALSRVDYRTKGPGWPASPGGGTGQLPSGNNWQDTATEQWVRGESSRASNFGGFTGQSFWYSNVANSDPGATQPYETMVPRWLFDGAAPDVSYTTFGTGTSTFMNYYIGAGRTNPFAVPFIPGDTDRDGICDGADIAKIAAVFGDNNWIFSNSFETAPQGDSGDPATQTRPWDVDGTGDNGIECSDLQWSLNFQGNTSGRVVGVRYDSSTPTPGAAGNVYLNSNAGTNVVVSMNAVVTGGGSIASIPVGGTVTVTVSAQLLGGANLSAGQENGVMQHIHDLALSTGGVLKVTSVTDLAHTTTRASYRALQGASGDLGVKRLNGYSTSFTNGLSAPTALYSVTLTAVATGSTNLTLGSSTEPKFAASTPRGVKIGHTNNNGDPATTTYPAPISLTVVTPACPGDINGDHAVGLADIAAIIQCWSLPASCNPAADLDASGTIGLGDVAGVIAHWGVTCP
ncbi:MAG TPA: hypothetical protein VG797_11925, partial [Phycisphaerales bacterium]|nr:hypothetical protein [Phycisphaerales bacterium]